MPNELGAAVRTSDALEQMFAEVRAEIIAESFATEQNSALLFPIARELESRAHARAREGLIGLSIEAKSIIGVFADFVGAKRTALLSEEFVTAAPASLTASPSPSSKIQAKAPQGPQSPVSTTDTNDSNAAAEENAKPDKDGDRNSPTLL